MSVQTIVDTQPFVFRPNLAVDQLKFKSPKRPKEIRSIPFALVPQMIEGKVERAGLCEIEFNYLIEEPLGETVRPEGAGVALAFGKHSNKLLSITIEYSTRDDFFKKLEDVRGYIEANRTRSEKDSSRHYFGLIEGIIRMIGDDMRSKPFPPESTTAPNTAD